MSPLKILHQRIGSIPLAAGYDSDRPPTPLLLQAVYEARAFLGHIRVYEYESSLGPFFQVSYALKPTVELDHRLDTGGLKLLLMIDGYLNIETQKPSVWQLSKGKCCFIHSPGYRIVLPENSNASYFLFDIEPLLEQLNWNGFPEQCFSLTPEMNTHLAELLQPPHPLYDPAGWLTIRIINILEPLREQIHRNTASGKIKGHERFALAADAYIQRNLDKQPRINEIARQVGLNESTLKTAFSVQFGVGMAKRRNLLRMELAKQLLTTTRLSINDIAIQCGYTPGDTFCNNFKTVFGTTPSDWRKNNVV